MYGTTFAGGLYRFTVAIAQPDFNSHLLLGPQGSLYGSNGIGGANNIGFIFKLSRSGFSIVASFPSDANRQAGTFPQGVVMDSAGNFFGTMSADGADLEGTVFEVRQQCGQAGGVPSGERPCMGKDVRAFMRSFSTGLLELAGFRRSRCGCRGPRARPGFFREACPRRDGRSSLAA